jgi:hypothetical protein
VGGGPGALIAARSIDRVTDQFSVDAIDNGAIPSGDFTERLLGRAGQEPHEVPKTSRTTLGLVAE